MHCLAGGQMDNLSPQYLPDTVIIAEEANRASTLSGAYIIGA